jgi:methionyl-tRNA synthetase
MSEPFYITTAIAYPNGKPHIGHAYEAIATDAIARFQRLMGRDVCFLTGTDEHGLKMDQTARGLGIPTQQLADEMSFYFKDMCAKLDISIDHFSRTTSDHHHKASQSIWKRLEANGDLYLDRYEGWYSVRDEAYYDESELTDGEGGTKLSPQGTPVEWTVEESWFFRLSKYQQPLLDFYATNPEFMRPESRKNETIRFVEGGLKDLSVSRTSFDWGVKVPGSDNHVMYVWLDALTTYISGIGFPDDTEEWRKYWPASVHIIGKDIVRFHTVYWPAFLMSAGLPLPKQVFGHGFLLAKDGEKMSKSLGNVVDPMGLAEQFGTDALRHYLLDTVQFGQDGTYSTFGLVEHNNAILGNSYGNLIQRVVAFIARKLDGRAPRFGVEEPIDTEFGVSIFKAHAHWLAAMHNFEISRATGACVEAFFACNKYVDEVAPWKALKDNPERAEHTLASLICALVRISLMMQPFTPNLASKALDVLQVAPPMRLRTDWSVEEWYEANCSSIIFENPTPIVEIFKLA